MDPFIGAKLNLLSNAQVRYTGILQSINTEEQTRESVSKLKRRPARRWRLRMRQASRLGYHAARTLPALQ